MIIAISGEWRGWDVGRRWGRGLVISLSAIGGV